MFSVGASPFNSPSRQLYGGWALNDAGDNVWGKKQFYSMSARYNPDEGERLKAREWLKAYKEAVRDNPARKRAVRRQGKPYWVDAIYPAMTPAQKRSIWESWLQVPFATDKPSQIASRMVRKAPYPNSRLMNQYALYGVPMMAKLEGVDDYPDANILAMFRNMDQVFRTARGARAARVGDIQRALEVAIDALNAPAVQGQGQGAVQDVEMQPGRHA